MDLETEISLLVRPALFWIQAGLIQGLAAQALASLVGTADSRPPLVGQPGAVKEERECYASCG